MIIPFTKAHGAGNDFLLTWADEAPSQHLSAFARAICARHTGIGADGWILVRGNAIQLFNADGSTAEISGNGTRCAAALLVDAGCACDEFDIVTGAGLKHLRVMARSGNSFLFEMNMGQPRVRDEQLRYQLPLTSGAREVTALDVGNPQCAVFVDAFPPDWGAISAEIEGHASFPNRTNVSFVRVLDKHTIDVRFYERGVGETLSSGTGSTGAAAAAIVRGLAKSPITIKTLAGDLKLRWDDSIYLTGPAVLIGSGSFYAPGLPDEERSH